MGKTNRIGLIDLGTNSVKFVVAEIGAGRFDVRHFDQATTRLGGGVATAGRIDRHGLARTIAAARRFRRMARRLGCDREFAFSTFALRRARNAAAARRRLQGDVGLPVRILSGAQEARFAYLSARRVLPRPRPNAVIFDVGGGSTEIVLARAGTACAARSLPLGALHLTEHFIKSDPITGHSLTSLHAYVTRRVGAALERMGVATAPSATDLVGSGGSVSTLARMVAAGVGRRRAAPRIRLGEVREMITHCSGMTLAQRRRVAGLDPARADIIVAGMMIVVAVMEALGKRVLHPNPGGVREGVLIHLAQNNLEW